MVDSDLQPYVPRLLSEWDLDAPGAGWRQVDGTLVFVDISGFTNLSERLARRGRIGAEELTEVLNRVFGAMLALAYQRGGSLLKFGGDALLLIFEGERHPVEAAAAAIEMRAALRRASEIPTSVGRIPLRMSVGIHTGLVDVFRVGDSHRELVIAGLTATVTTAMEHTAGPGEILVSPAMRRALPSGATGDARGDGYLLRGRKVDIPGGGVAARRPVAADVMGSCVPRILREHLGSGRVESEHRLATVAFVKFAGIDTAIAERGAESAARDLAQLVSAVQGAANAEEVTFLATDVDEDGGKIILCVGAPITREDDEGRILRTVRTIVQTPTTFPVRIGVNRGHVFAADIGTDFRRTFTVMGDTVNLAARLMAAAPDGSVYATPEVLDRSHSLFQTTPLEPFMVKGKVAPVQAYLVGPLTGTRDRTGGGATPLVGREDELATLSAAVGAAAAGTGSVLTIVGDTGAGKTRLVDEALRAVDDVDVLRLQSEPYGADNPYWVFRDPLRSRLGIDRTTQPDMRVALASAVERLAPQLSPLLSLIGDVVAIEVDDTDEVRAIETRYRPEQTANAVVRILERLQPGALVIHAEDTHWIDDASQFLLGRLAVATETRPWTLVVSTRPAGAAPLGRVIELAPLTEEQARALAIQATRAAPLRTHELDTVVARAGGNPLFLEEILRLVRQAGSVDELPESLDAVVGAEIDTLRPHTRRLLRYCSVLGRSFRRAVLDDFLGEEDVALDPATGRELARFIVGDGVGRLRFRHAVMQAAAYQGLSYRRRRELHQRAGEVIEHLADDPDSVAEFLAIHYALAGNAEKAWVFSRTAGHRAKSTFANVEAEGHYRRALEAWPRVPDAPIGERIEILTLLGDVREQAGLLAQALAAYREASALTRHEPVTNADIQLRSALVHMRTGAYRSALAATTRARRLVQEVVGPQAQCCLARALSSAAVVRMSQERPATAETLARQAIALAVEAGEDEALAKAYVVLDWALWMQGRSQEAVFGGEAMRIYESLGQPAKAASVMNNLGAYAYFDGRWDDAVDWYRKSIDSFRRGGSEAGGGLSAANTAEVLINQGRIHEAQELLEMAVRVLVSSGNEDDAMFALIQQARLVARQGESGDAVAVFRGLLERAKRMGRAVSAIEVSVHLSRALLDGGDFAAARRTLDEAAELGPAGVHGPAVAMVESDLAVASGDPAGALMWVERGLAVADEWGLVYESALLQDLRIRLSRTLGQPVDHETEERSRSTLLALGIGHDGM